MILFVLRFEELFDLAGLEGLDLDRVRGELDLAAMRLALLRKGLPAGDRA